MRILAVDPSICSLGWATYQRGVLEDFGTIKTEATASDVDRLEVIYSQLREKLLFPKVKHLVIEDAPKFLYDKRKGKVGAALSLLKLTKVVGLCCGMAFSHGVPAHLVLATTWKKQKKKSEIIRNAKLTWKLNKVGEDEAHAIELGAWWLKRKKMNMY